MKKIIINLLLIIGLYSQVIAQNVYSVEGSEILKNGMSWEFVGADNMAVFSIPYNYSTQQSQGMDISRECIDMKLTSDVALQSLVTSARNKGQVLILAGFWYDSDALPGGKSAYPGCQLLGANPQADPRWPAIMKRWKEIASLPFIKNKTDVWINPWNEPYSWDGTNGYNNDKWEKDSKAMVDSIRSSGANNIIALNGSHMGQGHEVIIERGNNLRQGRSNIVFDIHAYARWDVPVTTIRSRFQALRAAGNAFIIGEFAANGGYVYQSIMDACRAEKVSLLGWLWGQYKEPFAGIYKKYSMAPRNTKNSTLALSDTELQNDHINVYPNPFTDEIVIEGIIGSQAQVEIYNSLGQLEYKKEIENEQQPRFSLSFLNKGVYVLLIRQKSRIKNMKIMKN